MDKDICHDCKLKPPMLYCSKDKYLVCAKCGIEKHGDHKDLMDCEDLENEITKRYLSKIEGAESKIKKEGAGITNQYLQQAMGDIDAKVKENRDAAQACIQHIQKEFEGAAQELVKEGKRKVEMLDQRIKILEKIQKQEFNINESKEDFKNGNDQFKKTLECYKDLLDAEEEWKESTDEKKKEKFENDIKKYCDKNVLEDMRVSIEKALEKKKLIPMSVNATPRYIYYLNSLGSELCWLNTSLKECSIVNLLNPDGTKFVLKSRFASAAADNAIYISGGNTTTETEKAEKSKEYTYKEEIHAEAFEFSFLTERIRPIDNLRTERKDHNMESLDKYVYVIGGRNKEGILNKCERLNVTLGKKAKWEDIAPLSVPRVGPSVCSIRDKDNPVIYVIGGEDEKGFVKRIDRFLLSNEKWEEVAVKWCGEWVDRKNAGCINVTDGGITKILIFGGKGAKMCQDVFLFVGGDNKEIVRCDNCNLPEGMIFTQKNPAYSVNCNEIFISGEMCLYCFKKDMMTWTRMCQNEWFAY